MKRSTILILMNLFLLCAVCGLITYFWVFSQESYHTIERNTILTTQEYLEAGIYGQEDQIITLLRDYAWWNDTYQFASGAYPEYPDDNFNEISTQNLDVQQITILDNRNNTLWSTYSDPDTHHLVRREIPALFPLLIPSGENETRTVLEVIDEIPYLLCSVPILMTDAKGPVAGTIIFGRQINQNFCYALERSIHHPVTVSVQGSGSIPDLKSAYRFPDLVASITNETDDRIGNTFTTLSSDGQYIITFSIDRPKNIAIMGRNIISNSLIALILIAGGYTAIMTLILVSAFSQYEHDLEELESSRQEIRIHTERKQISDNIKQVLDTFLEFGVDTRENIHRLVSLTAEILHADCVTYSQIQSGEEEIIAATSLPPAYIQDHDPVGKITSYLIQSKPPDSCLYLPLARSGFDETDPLVKAGQYQTYHGCRTFSTEEHSGSLNVYYKSAYQPGELDQIIITLISNAIVAEESRGNFQTILQRRDRILEAISSAGTVLMRQADSHDLSMVPAIFGERLGVSRVYISIINQGQNAVIADQIPEPWIGTSGDSTLPLIAVYPEIDERIFNILSRIRNGEVVAGPIGSFEKKEQEYFSSRGIKSLAICPILKRRRLVGMLILEEHDRFREWIVPECEVLRIAGALIGATFERMENDFISQQYTLQLAEKSHELALKNIDLQERSAYIENLLERKKEMIIQIGHDLRTPLTPILGLIPLIVKTEENPDKREMLTRIEQGASRIRLLLDKILTLQQMDTVQPDEKNGCTDLGSLTEMVISRYQDQITQKEITVTTEVPGSLYASIPDKSLFLVIEELIRNAIRYSDPGGAISISGGQEANLILFCISDNGIGLTKTDKERVLDYFYKSDLSRHEIDTHGLGLPIVQHILDKYQGTISMESKGRGTGSRFCITLPVARDPEDNRSGKGNLNGTSE